MAEFARNELAMKIRSLLSSGKYSDLKITCGLDVYNVHRAIVCPLSGFLEKAEMFPMGKEAAEAIIDLPDDHPETIKLLVSFLYGAEYEPELPKIDCTKSGIWTVTAPKQDGFMYDFPHTCRPGCPSPNHTICPHHSCDSNTCNEACVKFVCAECTYPQPPDLDASQLIIHIRMYEIADKYLVVGLKDLAREKFDRACAKYWDDELFAPAAHHVFSTTSEYDNGLRDVVGRIISEHMILLNKPSVEALLEECNGLAFQVLKLRGTQLAWIKP